MLSLMHLFEPLKCQVIFTLRLTLNLPALKHFTQGRGVFFSIFSLYLETLGTKFKPF